MILAVKIQLWSESIGLFASIFMHISIVSRQSSFPIELGIPTLNLAATWTRPTAFGLCFSEKRKLKGFSFPNPA